MLVLFVVAGGVLGILLLNTKINENSFVIYELRQEQAKLDQQEQQLDREIAQSSSTAQLEAAARQIGLVDLRDDVVHLRLPAGPAGDEPAQQLEAQG